jgi:hypothetical protein
MYIYSYLFCPYYFKDYCHRATTQLQLVVVLVVVVVVVVIIIIIITPKILNLYPSLRMEAASFSETLVAVYQITCRMRRGWNVFFLS